MKSSIRSLAGLSILVVCAAGAIAQTNRGGISGTVFDKTGAVVPGAQVTITNVGTNRSQTLTTSEEGALYSGGARTGRLSPHGRGSGLQEGRG